MRTGYQPQIIFNAKGQIIAISTGSDACAEHECGIVEIKKTLIKSFSADTVIKNLTEFFESKSEPLKHLSEAKKIIPSIIDLNTITNHQAMRFHKTSHEAFLCFGFEGVPEKHPSLNYPFSFSDPKKEDCIAAAWSSNAFAFRVKGEKFINALEEFYNEIQKENCAFSGMFDFNTDESKAKLSGIILGNKSLYKDVTKQSISKAQEKYNLNIILKSLSKEEQIKTEMYQESEGESGPGFIWPVWKDNKQDEIMYALNPGYKVNAEYWGPYTANELIQWAKSKYSYQLTPSK